MAKLPGLMSWERTEAGVDAVDTEAARIEGAPDIGTDDDDTDELAEDMSLATHIDVTELIAGDRCDTLAAKAVAGDAEDCARLNHPRRVSELLGPPDSVLALAARAADRLDTLDGGL